MNFNIAKSAGASVKRIIFFKAAAKFRKTSKTGGEWRRKSKIFEIWRIWRRRRAAGRREAAKFSFQKTGGGRHAAGRRRPGGAANSSDFEA